MGEINPPLFQIRHLLCALLRKCTGSRSKISFEVLCSDNVYSCLIGMGIVHSAILENGGKDFQFTVTEEE